jgi:hypothetical protein
MRRIVPPCAPVQHVGTALPYTLTTKDERLAVTVYPGPPAYVYVTQDGLTEGEVDAGLLELSWSIPSPCCVVLLPRQL